MPDAPSDPSPIRELRRRLSGIVLADPLAVRALYVLDPRTGEPIVACRGDAGETDDWVLFVPEELEGALHLAAEPVLLDPDRDGACDRWKAYHGSPDGDRFFRLAVQWGRRGAESWEAEELRAVNRLAAVEARILRELNQDPAALGALAAKAAGWPAADQVTPGTAVGVDEQGVDVRVGRRVVRAEFPVEVGTAEEAMRAVTALRRADGGAQ